MLLLKSGIVKSVRLFDGVLYVATNNKLYKLVNENTFVEASKSNLKVADFLVLKDGKVVLVHNDGSVMCNSNRIAAVKLLEQHKRCCMFSFVEMNENRVDLYNNVIILSVSDKNAKLSFLSFLNKEKSKSMLNTVSILLKDVFEDLVVSGDIQFVDGLFTNENICLFFINAKDDSLCYLEIKKTVFEFSIKNSPNSPKLFVNKLNRVKIAGNGKISAFHVCGNTLAVGFATGHIHVFSFIDPTNTKLLFKYHWHSKAVLSVKISSNSLIHSCGHEGVFLTFNSRTNTKQFVPRISQHALTSIYLDNYYEFNICYVIDQKNVIYKIDVRNNKLADPILTDFCRFNGNIFLPHKLTSQILTLNDSRGPAVGFFNFRSGRFGEFLIENSTNIVTVNLIVRLNFTHAVMSACSKNLYLVEQSEDFTEANDFLRVHAFSYENKKFERLIKRPFVLGGLLPIYHVEIFILINFCNSKMENKNETDYFYCGNKSGFAVVSFDKTKKEFGYFSKYFDMKTELEDLEIVQVCQLDFKIDEIFLLALCSYKTAQLTKTYYLVLLSVNLSGQIKIVEKIDNIFIKQKESKNISQSNTCLMKAGEALYSNRLYITLNNELYIFEHEKFVFKQVASNTFGEKIVAVVFNDYSNSMMYFTEKFIYEEAGGVLEKLPFKSAYSIRSVCCTFDKTFSYFVMDEIGNIFSNNVRLVESNVVEKKKKKRVVNEVSSPVENFIANGKKTASFDNLMLTNTSNANNVLLIEEMLALYTTEIVDNFFI